MTTSSDHAASSSAHGSLKGYLIGFVLSVLLTVLPFWLVMGHVFESGVWTSVIILGLAAVQILVHVVCFLHVNPKSEDGWTLMSFIFTMVMVLIVLVGSIWVMYNLNVNMMPMMPHDARQLP